MDTIEAIMKRKSVRKYTDQEIDEDTMRIILEAGMSGPSCVNARDWQFIVVRNRDTLYKMAKANGRAARLLRGAAAGILICGDLKRAYNAAPEYWIIDGAIAGQNMILAAADLGIGSCWLGTYPQESRVKAQSAIFGLPDYVIPHSVIAFGYPAEGEELTERSHTDEPKLVHMEKW